MIFLFDYLKRIGIFEELFWLEILQIELVFSWFDIDNNGSPEEFLTSSKFLCTSSSCVTDTWLTAIPIALNLFQIFVIIRRLWSRFWIVMFSFRMTITDIFEIGTLFDIQACVFLEVRRQIFLADSFIISDENHDSVIWVITLQTFPILRMLWFFVLVWRFWQGRLNLGVVLERYGPILRQKSLLRPSKIASLC